jgi:hypothetical protein
MVFCLTLHRTPPYPGHVGVRALAVDKSEANEIYFFGEALQRPSLLCRASTAQLRHVLLRLSCAGIVDILQEYTSRKAGESFFKSILHNKHEISAVEPHLYAKRFIKFIDAHTM